FGGSELRGVAVRSAALDAEVCVLYYLSTPPGLLRGLCNGYGDGNTPLCLYNAGGWQRHVDESRDVRRGRMLWAPLLTACQRTQCGAVRIDHSIWRGNMEYSLLVLNDRERSRCPESSILFQESEG